ncbi:MAG TPA: hypothetical protein VEJ20_08745 [Candidatus Eremiobacteraceae bacterium]|nr:hypothetical protein [Candidatus Eremiobacteraceae bacterium]
MEIDIAEQGAFCLDSALSADEARGRASAHKGSAFGAMAKLFARPKDEDIQVEELGLCYVPMWHAKAHLRFVYDRRETYKVPIKAAHVKSVTIGAKDYSLSAASAPAVELPAVEHCERDEQRELWLDGLTSQAMNAQPYLKAGTTPISLDSFAPESAKIVAPTVRASAVIGTLLGKDFRPTDADEIKEEAVRVDCIDLHFRPTYGFKFVWAAKNKSADVVMDGITGEIKAEPSAASSALGKLLHPDTLFDLGAETLNLVVPGGSIALKVVRAISDRTKA